jgi:hypothetical protein
VLQQVTVILAFPPLVGGDVSLFIICRIVKVIWSLWVGIRGADTAGQISGPGIHDAVTRWGAAHAGSRARLRAGGAADNRPGTWRGAEGAAHTRL